MSGWRRSVCDCGCGDPTECANSGCGLCDGGVIYPSGIDNCGHSVSTPGGNRGLSCPATHAVTVNVPSITLSRTRCGSITFSSFSVSGTLDRSTYEYTCPPDCNTGCRWNDGHVSSKVIGTGGGTQVIDSDSCAACGTDVTIGPIRVRAALTIFQADDGPPYPATAGRTFHGSVALDIYYDGDWQSTACGGSSNFFWIPAGGTSPSVGFTAGCGCLPSGGVEYSSQRYAKTSPCGCWETTGTHPTVTWEIT